MSVMFLCDICFTTSSISASSSLIHIILYVCMYMYRVYVHVCMYVCICYCIGCMYGGEGTHVW